MKLALGSALLAVAFIAGPTAHASPDTDDIVCQQSRLGEDPGTIADQLHNGDPRHSIWQTTQQVWTDLQDC